MTTKPLTVRQQTGLEHIRRAEESSVSLSQYANTHGLKAKDLYNVKRQLVKKGVMGEPVKTDNDFVPVRAIDAITTVCRLRHPSGWEIGCHHWPPTDWLIAVLERQ